MLKSDVIDRNDTIHNRLLVKKDLQSFVGSTRHDSPILEYGGYFC